MRKPPIAVILVAVFLGIDMALPAIPASANESSGTYIVKVLPGDQDRVTQYGR